MKRSGVLLVVLIVMIAAGCGSTRQPLETATAAASTSPPPAPSITSSTPPATASPTATPSKLRPPIMPSTLQDMPIVYYDFVAVASKSAPAGSVVILLDELILGPTLSEIDRSPDPVTNIRSALGAMLDDPRNAWTSDKVGITGVSLKNGAARVELQGDYFAVGDIVLIAARWQIILTVFAESAVQSALITLNGKNIANLGVSHSRNAKPEDFTYTRSDVDAFLAENEYSNPQ